MTKFNNPLKTMRMLQKIRMEQAVLKHSIMVIIAIGNNSNITYSYYLSDQISNFSIPVRGNVTAHQNTDQTF
jgi:uncharacterized protein (UPF0333 family)